MIEDKYESGMVSVIIPCFNRSRTVEKAAFSVLNQTYNNIEVIIVDDGSTDDTRDIVLGWNDSRVHYVYQDNAGACAARNHGIELANGEYIAFQDSDDEWKTDKLEKQIDVFKSDCTIDIVCCKTICKRLDGSLMLAMYGFPGGIIDKQRGPGGITTQTLVMKRRVTENINFDINVLRYQDLDFLIMAQQSDFKIYCLNDCLVEREICIDSITNHPERILQMSFYFEEKYPMIMNQKQNYLSHFFSGTLMKTGQEIVLNGGNGKDYFHRALELEHTPIALLKYGMIRTNIYPIYRKMIEKYFTK